MHPSSPTRKINVGTHCMYEKAKVNNTINVIIIFIALFSSLVRTHAYCIYRPQNRIIIYNMFGGENRVSNLAHHAYVMAGVIIRGVIAIIITIV